MAFDSNFNLFNLKPIDPKEIEDNQIAYKRKFRYVRR